MTHSNEETSVRYPVGATAYSKSLVTEVTVIEVRHDQRKVEWTRSGDDPRPHTNWLRLDELSDVPMDPLIEHMNTDSSIPTLYDIGSEAFYQGERVRVIATDLFSRRKVRYMDLVELSEHWVDVRALAADPLPLPHDQAPMGPLIESLLSTHVDGAWWNTLSDLASDLANAKTPSVETAAWYALKSHVQTYQPPPTPAILHHPADPLTVDQACDIAEREMEIAGDKDATIRELEKRLQAQLWAANRALDQKATAEKERDALAAENKRYEVLNQKLYDERNRLGKQVTYLEGELAAQPESTVKRKIETVTKKNITDEDIANLINKGWRVVFETAYVMGGYEEAYDFHVIRFERECPDTPTPPRDETHTFVAVPRPVNEAPYAEDIPTGDDEPVITYEHEQPTEIVFHVGEPSYEMIDPAQIDLSQPLTANLSKYGYEAVRKAQDLVILSGMKTAALAWNAAQQRLISTPTRFQPQQHA